MSDCHKILEEIDVDLENLISPAVCLNNSNTLGNFFASIKKIEYKIDRLKNCIEQHIENSTPLVNFLDSNLTLQTFLYIECPYIVHDIQQIQEQLPRIDDRTLDFSNEAMWTKPRCQLLKKWLSRGNVYDAISNDFKNKWAVFKKNLTILSKLTNEHIERYGLVAASTNKRDIAFESPDFTGVKNSMLKKILERDYSEIQKCLANECWKAAIILCGSSIEALLFDCLLCCEKDVKSFIPIGKKLEDLRLKQLIDIAKGLNLITVGVEKFSHSLRDYRNLVHPVKELKADYVIGGPEARTCFEVLNMVIRDIKEKNRLGDE